MKKTTSTILSVLFGIVMIVFGLNKFFPFVPMPAPTAEQMEIYGAFGKLKWIIPLAGLAEIAGGILFMIPKTRALAALIVLPVTAGIFIHNLTFFTSFGDFTLPLFLMAVNIWVIYDNRDKYIPMLK